MRYPTDPTAGPRRRLLGTTAIGACAAALCTLSPGDAAAAGFALKEQSTTAMGNAFAGATAGAEDITYMYFNPAGLTRHEGTQAAVVLSYIIPQGETKDAAMSPVIDGRPGESTSGDAAEDALVPAAYLMWSVNPDLKFGLGVNTPFGLSTKYSQTWAGRYDAVESSIVSVNVNPTVAYRVSESLSIGGGLQIQYMDVTLSQMAFSGIPNVDLLAKVTGNDWAYGFNVGALYEISEATRFGLAYRSRLSHNLAGGFSVAGAPVSGANADFTAPELVTLGAYHDINQQWAIMGEAQWQGWSTFKELRVVDDLGNLISLTPENWDDSWFFSVGATWRPSGNWTLRGGLAYEQTPVPDATRTPRLTDEDRTWVAVGAQFHPTPSFSVDAGYTHLFIKDASVNLPNRIGLGGPPALTANYENSVDIISIQGVLRF